MPSGTIHSHSKKKKRKKKKYSLYGEKKKSNVTLPLISRAMVILVSSRSSGGSGRGVGYVLVWVVMGHVLHRRQRQRLKLVVPCHIVPDSLLLIPAGLQVLVHVLTLLLLLLLVLSTFWTLFLVSVIIN